MKPKASLLAALVLLCGPATAQVVVDGTITGDAYGPALAVQTVQTMFGDNQNELDAAYGRIENGRLYVALTGNIDTSFIRLEVLIDSIPGGENVYSGVPGNDGTGVMAGLTFDAGFEADHHLILRRGFVGMFPHFDVDFARLGTPLFSSYSDVFNYGVKGEALTGTGPANASPIEISYNPSNISGITGGTGPADPAAALAVTTGVEFSIALGDLGDPVGPVRVLAFINTPLHECASNQFLGGLAPPQGIPCGDGAGNQPGTTSFDLGTFAGDQYFVVPAGLAAPGAVYCNGDDSGTPCPCGNPNDGSFGVAGCANLVGPGCNNGGGGVALRGSGSNSITAADAALTAIGGQAGQLGLYFRADEVVNGGSGVTFGDGLRCAGVNVVRMQGAVANDAGASRTTVSISAGLSPGDLRRYQFWCRIPAYSPCATGFTLSNGYEITWAP